MNSESDCKIRRGALFELVETRYIVTIAYSPLSVNEHSEITPRSRSGLKKGASIWRGWHSGGCVDIPESKRGTGQRSILPLSPTPSIVAQGSARFEKWQNQIGRWTFSMKKFQLSSWDNLKFKKK